MSESVHAGDRVADALLEHFEGYGRGPTVYIRCFFDSSIDTVLLHVR